MFHTFTDEEYKDYQAWQEKYCKLSEFKCDVLHNGDLFFQRNVTPCQKGRDYCCDSCSIGLLIPGKCVSGKEVRFSK